MPVSTRSMTASTRRAPAVELVQPAGAGLAVQGAKLNDPNTVLTPTVAPMQIRPWALASWPDGQTCFSVAPEPEPGGAGGWALLMIMARNRKVDCSFGPCAGPSTARKLAPVGPGTLR